MIARWQFFISAAAVAAVWTAAAAQTTIVMDAGRFPLPEIAAAAEQTVDWLDADLADDTACTECFAAVELQKYLRRLTGRVEDFAVVDDQAAPAGELILVGGPGSNALSKAWAGPLGLEGGELAKLGPQGYRIRTARVDGRRVTVLAGGGRAGTLYAAYELLHLMGVRWFGPEASQEEVPRAAWAPAFDVIETPDFVSRGFHAWGDRGNDDFILWMGRNRLNEWTAGYKNIALMHKLAIQGVAGGHDDMGRFLGPNLEYPYDHPDFQGDEAKPKDPYAKSSLDQGDTDRDGKLSYFEAHPEWYALSGGKRIPGIVNGWTGVNFCTSNPDARREFFKNFVDAVVDGCYRGTDRLRFWTLDGGKWCECEACQALGSPTDRNLRLVGQLDAELKRARRKGRLHRAIPIRFLAYADVIRPPTRPLPEDFDYATCTATFYPINRCYVHEFDDPNCLQNAAYAKDLWGWATDPARHYRGQIEIGEYYNVSRFRSLPICFMHSMAHDLPCYDQVGARYFQYMHVTTGHWGNKSLTNYQMARQTWDIQTDCEALWRDFFGRRYGPAAGPMRAFYESLEKMLSNVAALKAWGTGLGPQLDRGDANLFNQPHLRYRREPGVACEGPTLVEMVEAGRECRRLIDRALAADVPERIRQRLVEDERMFTYGERTLAYYDACAQAFLLGRAGRIEEARGHLAEAKRLAELLRADTWSTDLAHQDAQPLDALSTTMATGAVEHLEKLLAEPVEENPRKTGP